MFKEIPKITNIESFLSKIKISNDSECWIWNGNIYKDGYGRIGISYKSYQAHRVSHDIFNGFKDHNMLIDHKCRNRSCVNPEHLWTGTVAENNKDRHQKGRTVVPGLKGEDQPNSRLTEIDVSAIRNDPRVQSLVAAQYGVNQSVVSRIKNLKAWRHL